MSNVQALARRQQVVEELCAASIRAISGETDLHFRGGRLHRGRHPLPLYAPHLKPSLGSDDFDSFRGAADGLALRLANSDAALHRRLRPDDPLERLLFEVLEQIRAEALVPADLPGARRNLRHRFEAWSLASHHGGLTDSARGLLLYTVIQVCRSRVTAEPVVEATDDLLEATRAAIGPSIGADLAGLRRTRAEQAPYARHALNIARTIAAMVHSTDAETPADDSADDDWAAFNLVLDHDDELEDDVARAVSGHSRALDEAADGYRVFTRAYDSELDAASLVRAALLKEYRERLDRGIAELGINLAHMTRDLKALLARPVRDGWDDGQEEGHVDGRRLAQLIASPTERRLFRTEREDRQADCVVSVLIDCSGSMKEHIESVAMLVDVFVRALEQAGVESEVLGFTTTAWNGGRTRRDWLRAGRPRHPGRLNETCHLVFKDADTTWRRARPQLAALLKADLFREGIDGEAVTWAQRRLAARTEQRRLLIVISDGSPMDSATNLANDTHYLDHHLREVVAQHEAAGAEIYGLGVGLDLSPYYSRSHVLDLSNALSMTVFREIIAMIARGQRR